MRVCEVPPRLRKFDDELRRAVRQSVELTPARSTFDRTNVVSSIAVLRAAPALQDRAHLIEFLIFVAIPDLGRHHLVEGIERARVLPELDLGIQKGMQRAYRMRKLPTPKRVLEVGRPWAPYRTIASWYLWRSLEVD